MPRTFLSLLMLAAPLGLNSAETAPYICKTELCGFVASGHLSDLRWPDFSDYRNWIERLYEPTDYAYAWIYQGTATVQARAIIEILKNADSKGLDPEDYDGSRWEHRLDALSHSPSGSDLARFDLALTVSLMRYISDLHLGKANPGLFHADFDLGNEKSNLADFIRQRLVHATDVKAALEGVEPPYDGYRRTEEALQRYLILAHEDRHELLPPTKKPVDPGGLYIATAQLATLLRRLGDLPQGAVLRSDPNLYGGPLVDAVKHFQARHGLEPDGRLGPATLTQLNTPLSHRVLQLQLTLERWRWVPHRFPRAPIVVNIPEFQLRALNSAYETDLEMKVVVGKAYHHRTPVFEADMKYVVFRPYWDVPRGIQLRELVPKLELDRSYFAKNGYEAVTPQGAVVSSGIVDDQILGRIRSGELRVRQIPGPENALGLVKFLFPNEHNVYLHATPATELFAKFRRDFSHGCIRVEKPEELAAWVLRERPEWTPERIASAMNGTKTIQITLGHPIPVLIVYATAVVLKGGEVRFFQDIYGEDAQLEQQIAKGYPYRPAGGGSGTRLPE